jgi:hypothetical protein
MGSWTRELTSTRTVNKKRALSMSPFLIAMCKKFWPLESNC